MKNKGSFMVGVVLMITAILVCVLAYLINSWTETGYGTLDPKVAVFVKLVELQGGPPLDRGAPITEVRSAIHKTRVFKYPPTQIAQVSNQTIPGPAGPLPVRIYHPRPDVILPIVIYFHGGGWVMGDLDTSDNNCRSIAAKANVIVISPAYRLAPENPFPAAVDDACATVLWAHQNAAQLNGDPMRIAVAGDSAGGNLAAAVALKMRDLQPSLITCQVLIYPVIDLCTMDTPSYQHFATGYYLTRESMRRFRAMYLPENDLWCTPSASPAKAASLAGLPPAFIVTAEIDVLRDEGETYAARLREAGVPVESRRYAGVIHGFMSLEKLSKQAARAYDDVARFLDRQLGHPITSRVRTPLLQLTDKERE